jgi:flagellar basal-body rod protein FlgC
MEISKAMRVAASGMKAQSARLRVTAENLANAESTAAEPGGEPYRRRTLTFADRLDRALGVRLVEVRRHGVDRSELPLRHDPGHPAADEDGYVKLPNVNPMIELMDMREAQRSFEANLGALEMARAMVQRTIDLLR